MMSIGTEFESVKQVYSRRTDDFGENSLYQPARPDRVLGRQEKEREIAGHLQRKYLGRIGSLVVLEVGCGDGTNLRLFQALGVEPRNLTGVDLVSNRIERARAESAATMTLICGEATVQDFPPESFDIVIASTVFDSILDPRARKALAECMWMWLKPGGDILWYDFVVNNPKNPDVRGVPVSEVRELFPSGSLSSRRMTLAPPIGRLLAPRSVVAYKIASLVPWLNTHVMIWIEKSQTDTMGTRIV